MVTKWIFTIEGISKFFDIVIELLTGLFKTEKIASVAERSNE